MFIFSKFVSLFQKEAEIGNQEQKNIVLIKNASLINVIVKFEHDHLEEN